MKSNYTIVVLGLFFLTFNSGYSQSRKSVDDFTLKDVIDNKEYSLSSFSNSKGICVIFNSTECPYSVYYDDRLNSIIKKYSGKGISFLIINSNFGNSASAENLDKLKIHARVFNVPYLVDMAQDALSKLGARKSPEAFLLRSDNGKFSINYQGAIDDNPQVSSDVHVRYLENAIEQILKNQNARPAFVNPAGCIIKKR